MRAQPTPQERPNACQYVDMHCTPALLIFIAGKLASLMVDTLMAVYPATQAGINAVLLVYTRVPGTIVSLIKGSMVLSCTFAMRWITT